MVDGASSASSDDEGAVVGSGLSNAARSGAGGAGGAGAGSSSAGSGGAGAGSGGAGAGRRGSGRSASPSADAPEPAAVVGAWFDAHIPNGWFTGPVEVVLDREEVLVTGTLRDPGPSAGEAARLGAIAHFREATRGDRVTLASAAEAMLGRKVSWGVTCGPVRDVFTSLSVPVMTRLRMQERMVLDTLVDASVARTRSEALAWCVRLVAQHEGDWVRELREAMVEVERVRRAGPKA